MMSKSKRKTLPFVYWNVWRLLWSISYSEIW